MLSCSEMRMKKKYVKRLVTLVIVFNFIQLTYFLLHRSPPPDHIPQEVNHPGKTTDLPPEFTRIVHPYVVKKWFQVPSLTSWSADSKRAPVHSCEAFFGNGFTEVHQLVTNPVDKGGTLRCHFSDTLRTSVCEGTKMVMHPSRISMAAGGEEIDSVLGRNEADEMPDYRERAFEIQVPDAGLTSKAVVSDSQLDSVMPRGQVSRHPMRALVESIRTTSFRITHGRWLGSLFHRGKIRKALQRQRLLRPRSVCTAGIRHGSLQITRHRSTMHRRLTSPPRLFKDRQTPRVRRELLILHFLPESYPRKSASRENQALQRQVLFIRREGYLPGFLLPDNPNDVVYMALPSSTELRVPSNQETEFTNYNAGQYCIQRSGTPSFSLLKALRIRASPASLRKSRAYLALQGLPISRENDLKVFHWLESKCKMMLEELPTSITEDAEMLCLLKTNSNKQDERLELAVQWRLGYKEILQRCISYSQVKIQQL